MPPSLTAVLASFEACPYCHTLLAEWQQANTARAESEQVAHHATSISTDLSETREQSQLRSAEAARLVSQAPVAKRQKIASNAADKEQ